MIGAAAIGMLLTLFAIVHRGSAIIDQQKRALKLRLREQSRLHHINDLLKEKMQKAMRESTESIAQSRSELAHNCMTAQPNF